MNHLVYEDPFVTETIMKLFNLICYSESQMVVGQKRAYLLTATKRYQVGYVKLHANVEVWFVEVTKELEYVASLPLAHIKVVRHEHDCKRSRTVKHLVTGSAFGHLSASRASRISSFTGRSR